MRKTPRQDVIMSRQIKLQQAIFEQALMTQFNDELAVGLSI